MSLTPHRSKNHSDSKASYSTHEELYHEKDTIRGSDDCGEASSVVSEDQVSSTKGTVADGSTYKDQLHIGDTEKDTKPHTLNERGPVSVGFTDQMRKNMSNYHLNHPSHFVKIDEENEGGSTVNGNGKGHARFDPESDQNSVVRADKRLLGINSRGRGGSSMDRNRGGSHSRQMMGKEKIELPFSIELANYYLKKHEGIFDNGLNEYETAESSSTTSHQTSTSKGFSNGQEQSHSNGNGQSNSYSNGNSNGHSSFNRLAQMDQIESNKENKVPSKYQNYKKKGKEFNLESAETEMTYKILAHGNTKENTDALDMHIKKVLRARGLWQILAKS